MPKRIARRRLLALTGVAAFVAACGSESSKETVATTTAGQGPVTSGSAPKEAEPKTGGTVRVGIAAEPTNLDPHTGGSGAEHQFMYPVYDQLIAYDQKGQLDPSQSLAEKWELAEPTRVVLKLRTGVTFTDGTPLNAAAVKWNLDRIIDPATKATPRPDLAAIERVEALSATDLVLRLKEPSAPLLTNLGDRGGMMISPPAFEKAGKDEYRRNPVGSGPFVLKEFVSDARLVYERNPAYWRKDASGRGLPFAQRLRLDIIPDNTVRVAALESGEIDVIQSTPAQDVKRLGANKDFQLTRFVGAGTIHSVVNHGFAPLDNVWFRRAVAAGHDRESYIKNFLTGEEPVAAALLTPASWAFEPNVPAYPYEIAKAKEYLQRSGLPPSAWRIKVVPKGTSVSDNESFFENSLKSAGIVVEWLKGERESVFLRLWKGLGADGTAAMNLQGSWSMRVDPDGNCGQFYTEKGTYNPGQAPVPELEPLMLRARQIYDQTERKKLYSEIQRLAAEHVYSSMPIHYTIADAHASTKVGNFAAYYGGEGKARFANLWI